MLRVKYMTPGRKVSMTAKNALVMQTVARVRRAKDGVVGEGRSCCDVGVLIEHSLSSQKIARVFELCEVSSRLNGRIARAFNLAVSTLLIISWFVVF